MFRCPTSRRILQRAFAVQRAQTQELHPSHPTCVSPRCFTTSPTSFARKDTQEKDSINTSSNEYSKSGSDGDAASSGAAFDPGNTSPEGENKTAEKEGGGNSLDVSPSNPEVSKPRGSEEGGAASSPRTKTSGGGSPQKGGTDGKHA